MKKNLLISFLAFGLLLVMTGCGVSVIRNVPTQPIAQQISQQNVFKAIYKAGLLRSWEVHKIRNGLIEATHSRGKYSVTISINYSSHGYSIDYKSSQGLKYNEATQTIHKSYNRWIANLEKQINSELSLISKSGSVSTSVEPSVQIVTETASKTITKNASSNSTNTDSDW